MFLNAKRVDIVWKFELNKWRENKKVYKKVQINIMFAHSRGGYDNVAPHDNVD